MVYGTDHPTFNSNAAHKNALKHCGTFHKIYHAYINLMQVLCLHCFLGLITTQCKSRYMVLLNVICHRVWLSTNAKDPLRQEKRRDAFYQFVLTGEVFFTFNQFQDVANNAIPYIKHETYNLTAAQEMLNMFCIRRCPWQIIWYNRIRLCMLYTTLIASGQ